MRLPGKKTRTIFVIVLALLISIQFVSPRITNEPATHPIKAPEQVLAVLHRACYDCHSNAGRFSWYDRLAPASWLVAADVKEARSRFNLSTWDTLSPADQQGRLWEMVNMALTNKMPLATYAALHPKARLSESEINVLKRYAEAGSPAKFHDTALIAEAARELDAIALGHRPETKDLTAADGIKYIQGFEDWQVIGTTNRFDNHSIRVLYGNPIAAEAIREGHTDPLPEGSTIVKMVWNSIEEADGNIYPGSLNSVQIMTKDKTRFPDTKGWGFAKFNGIGLKPYGHVAAFNTTCFNCHKIADKNDYVFNLPSNPKLFDAGGLKVISVFANRINKTMSVLYGNEAAKRSATQGFKTRFPGEWYKLVTYRQTDNRFWYGSYINGEILSVDTYSEPQPIFRQPAVFP